MDLHTAFMRTADRIEKNPGCCFLTDVLIPERETSYGCVLGWIGYEMGMRRAHADDVLHLLGLDHFTDFSVRMLSLHDFHDHRSWYRAPETIRAYAEKYHPKPVITIHPELAKLLKGMDTFFTENA